MNLKPLIFARLFRDPPREKAERFTPVSFRGRASEMTIDFFPGLHFPCADRAGGKLKLPIIFTAPGHRDFFSLRNGNRSLENVLRAPLQQRTRLIQAAIYTLI